MIRRKELTHILAQIKIDSKQTFQIEVYRRHFRFNCRRCATFCCKLGGPVLTNEDVKRLNSLEHVKEFIKPLTKNEHDLRARVSTYVSRLKTVENGACIFLRFNFIQKQYECSIYESRPAACRRFPLYLNQIDENTLMVELIPCCRGLNTRDGTVIGIRFLKEQIIDALARCICTSDSSYNQSTVDTPVHTV